MGPSLNKTIWASGFTLVEIALALLVVSVGAVALLGLFPAGIEASRRADDETRIAMFAADVFSSYKAALAVLPANEVLSDSHKEIRYVSAIDAWVGDELNVNPVFDENNQDFYVISYTTPDSTLPDFSLRYRLYIEAVGRVVNLRLVVLPGQFPPEPNVTDDNADDYEEPYIFYTEIYDH